MGDEKKRNFSCDVGLSLVRSQPNIARPIVERERLEAERFYLKVVSSLFS